MKTLVEKVKSKGVDLPGQCYPCENHDYGRHLDGVLLTFALQLSNKRDFFDYFYLVKLKQFRSNEGLLRRFWIGLVHFMGRENDKTDVKFYLFLLANNISRRTVTELNSALNKLTGLKVEMKSFYEHQDFILQIHHVLRLSGEELFELKSRVDASRINGRFVKTSLLRQSVLEILYRRMSDAVARKEIVEPPPDFKISFAKPPVQMKPRSVKKAKEFSCFRFDFSQEKPTKKESATPTAGNQNNQNESVAIEDKNASEKGQKSRLFV
jgi:hypothetical protein